MKRLSAIKKTACIAMTLMILTCGCAAAWGHYASSQEANGFSLNIDAKNKNLYIDAIMTTWPFVRDPDSYYQKITDTERFSFDVIVDGQLVADDVIIFHGAIPVGASYQITDLKGELVFETDSNGQSLHGTATDSCKYYHLACKSSNAYFVDVKSPFCTFDVYIEGECIWHNQSSYWFSHPIGTTYTVTNIQPISGYTYNGPAEFTGVVGTQNAIVHIGSEYFTEE